MCLSLILVSTTLRCASRFQVIYNVESHTLDVFETRSLYDLMSHFADCQLRFFYLKHLTSKIRNCNDFLQHALKLGHL